MLLSRSLPPQFLIPAWSIPLLTQHHQRTYKTTNTTASSIPPKTPSLFDELFPNETPPETLLPPPRDLKLEKLPIFTWNAEVKVQREKERKAIKEYGPTWGSTKPGMVRRVEGLKHLAGKSKQSEKEKGKGRRRDVSVVVLNSALSSLEESDFFRLGPKSEHIEGWTSGILKVILARDNTTLKPLNHYFILFTSLSTATAYIDNTIRLHRLSKASSTWDTKSIISFPLPPHLLKSTEDSKAAINSFSLAPPFARLNIRLVATPHTPAVKRLLEDQGPAAIARSKSKTEDMVLVYTDMGHVGFDHLKQAIVEDGRRRNLHWRLAGTRDDILVLEEPGTNKSTVRSGRYVISFKDRYEARRFAREWHRRPIPIKWRGKLGTELPPIVNAEILW